MKTNNPQEATTDFSAYIRITELKRVVPFSSATIWRKVKNGSFVKPKKLSDRITAWNRSEVYAWLESKGRA